ncbi:monofunctional biosynthetic peptidoglycan transglycosylase [Dongia sp.]|uniref:monofunctional biosynthetic peptidoglycan transglycosylase n=1 Tax=Dongia sp. TaxID=1977262 RepID=UPI003751249D
MPEGEPEVIAAAPPKRGLVRRVLRFVARAIGLFLLISVFWTALYAWLPVPLTPLMVIRLVQGHGFSKDWVSYEEISPNLPRAAIAAEDSGYCAHRGFEWEAIQKAWNRNAKSKRIRGGSTISNQTAKNAFLWPDRTYIRKALEYYFTGLIELMWGKKRILEVYLNVVEFGPGIYGAEAAAQTYFKKPASQLSGREAALLVAVLPSPLKWSVAKPGPYVQSRTATIMARMMDIPDPKDDPCGRKGG